MLTGLSWMLATQANSLAMLYLTYGVVGGLGTGIVYVGVMMSLMSTSGLMVTSQMAAFGADFGITKALVFGMAALPLALTVDRFTNGLTRPFFGWVSDRIGRENTMCLAFALEAAAMSLWLITRGDPLLFVLLSSRCSLRR